jgi:hypothetical protein
MTLICARTTSIRRMVLLALPFSLILAACSGRGQTAVGPQATEGYGSSAPPRVSSPTSVPGSYPLYDRVTPPRGALNPYAPYDQLTDSARRSNRQ